MANISRILGEFAFDGKRNKIPVSKIPHDLEIKITPVCDDQTNTESDETSKSFVTR